MEYARQDTAATVAERGDGRAVAGPTNARAKRDWAAPLGRGEITRGVVSQFARAMALQEIELERERRARAARPVEEANAALSFVVGEPGSESIAQTLHRVRHERRAIVIFVAGDITEDAPLAICGRRLKIMADPAAPGGRAPVLTLAGGAPVGMTLDDSASDVCLAGLSIKQSADARPALREIQARAHVASPRLHGVGPRRRRSLHGDSADVRVPQVHSKPLVHAPSSSHACTLSGFAGGASAGSRGGSVTSAGCSVACPVAIFVGAGRLTLQDCHVTAPAGAPQPASPRLRLAGPSRHRGARRRRRGCQRRSRTSVRAQLHDRLLRAPRGAARAAAKRCSRRARRCAPLR